MLTLVLSVLSTFLIQTKSHLPTHLPSVHDLSEILWNEACANYMNEVTVLLVAPTAFVLSMMAADHIFGLSLPLEVGPFVELYRFYPTLHLWSPSPEVVEPTLLSDWLTDSARVAKRAVDVALSPKETPGFLETMNASVDRSTLYHYNNPRPLATTFKQWARTHFDPFWMMEIEPYTGRGSERLPSNFDRPDVTRDGKFLPYSQRSKEPFRYGFELEDQIYGNGPRTFPWKVEDSLKEYVWEDRDRRDFFSNMMFTNECGPIAVPRGKNLLKRTPYSEELNYWLDLPW